MCKGFAARLKKVHTDAPAKEHVHMLDLVRGLMILLMAARHLLYDLVYLYSWPEWIENNIFIRIASPFGAGLFIAMSGATAMISRSNVKRGLRILLAAAAVTGVTYLFEPETVIVFGILHFLSVSSLLYALLKPLLDRIPPQIKPAVYSAGLVLSLLLRSVLTGGAWWLLPLGFPPENFCTLDYFPLLPWFFVYLLGTWFGEPVFERKLPEWFYTARAPFLETCGRWSLWIYLLHQPVILLIVEGLRIFV